MEASRPGWGQGKEVIAARARAEGPRPWPGTESAPSANSLFSEPRALGPDAPPNQPPQHLSRAKRLSAPLPAESARLGKGFRGGCPPWLFPPPPNPCLPPPPRARSRVRFPGPDGVPAHLDATDWLSLPVPSRRPAAGARPPPPGTARGREIHNWEMGGERRSRSRPCHP